MKALSFSRLVFVLGLTLGIMVLLAGVSPTVLNANSLTGGSFTGCAGNPCSYDSTEDCANAQTGPGSPPGSLGCDGGQDYIYCPKDPNGTDTCTANGNIPCSTPSLPSSHPCNTVHSMSCM